MNLHEYQSKALFRDYGIPTPVGKIAKTAEEAKAAAESLSTSTVVVKAQVHAGGRGKTGGIKLVKSPEAATMIGSAQGSNTDVDLHPDGFNEVVVVSRPHRLFESPQIDQALDKIMVLYLKSRSKISKFREPNIAIELRYGLSKTFEILMSPHRVKLAHEPMISDWNSRLLLENRCSQEAIKFMNSHSQKIDANAKILKKEECPYPSNPTEMLDKDHPLGPQATLVSFIRKFNISRFRGPVLVRPPGYGFLRVIEIFASSNQVELLYKPIVADWNEDYNQALANKRSWLKLLGIRIRYTLALFMAMGLDSFTKAVTKIWTNKKL